MTSDLIRHLSAEEFDAWLDRALVGPRLVHLDACESCRNQAHAHRAIAELLRRLPALEPRPGFADRVMAQVTIPGALVAIQPVRRRPRWSPPLAASVGLALTGAGASVAWSLAHPELLTHAAARITGLIGDWSWTAVRAVVSTLMEQPWYPEARSLLGTPARAVLAVMGASFAYLSGLLAFRRLVTAPTRQTARAAF